MPTKITPLPVLLQQVRMLRKKIVQLEAEGLCLFGAWLEKNRPGSVRSRRQVYWQLRCRTGTLPNRKQLMHLDKEQVPIYQQAIARGRKIKACQRQIRDTERRIERLVARAEQRGIVVRNVLGDPDASPEWYTPPGYISLVRQVLGHIDLDPASNSMAQAWIQADVYYTKQDDGLRQPWFGRVWCNPPYGSPETRLMAQQFLEKAIAAYQDGMVVAVILLLNRTGAAWYKTLQQQVTALCEVTKRIAFLDENGVPQPSPRYYSDFLYLGQEPERFLDIFSSIGTVRQLAP